MYDNYIGGSKFKEIRNLINDYIDWGENSTKLTLEEIGDKAYEYYEAGLLSSSQYDYLSGLIEDLE